MVMDTWDTWDKFLENFKKKIKKYKNKNIEF
jgi:hypothetical protein